MVKALLFDLDGTLLDSVDDLTVAINNTLSARSLPEISRADVALFIGKGAKVLVERALRKSMQREPEANFVDEVLPGDTFSLNTTLFSRLSTPVVPFMDNLFLETFFFYVPDRLVWDNFQKMMGEQENPGDSTDYLIPQITVTNAENQSIFDYFGIPTRISNGLKVNALPFRAYNLIWNEWFRDENLQDSVTVAKGDSGDPTYTLLKRGKRHDYFTSALPWPQKGDAIDVPVNEMLIVELYSK